jgi:hypothetical protein
LLRWRAVPRPTVEDVRRLLALAGSREDYEHVFGELRSAAWIPALIEAGTFDSPEPPVRQGAYILFPVWGPSRYLARVADQDPDGVLEVLLRLPETENWRIQVDVIDAGMALPARLAVRLVPRVLTWLAQPSYGLVAERATALMKRFVADGLTEAALQIARALLALEARDKPALSLGDEPATRAEATPHIDDYWYRQFLDKEFSAVVAVAAMPSLRLISDVLAEGLGLEHASEEDALPGKREDFSWIWRPAIEDHSQNQDFDVLAVLVEAVRDASLAAIRAGVHILEVVALIRTYSFAVFERMALHILVEHGNEARDLVAEALTSRDLHDSRATWHEFSRLARSRFPQLPVEDQQAYLQLVDQTLEQSAGEERSKGWAVLRLWAIEPHLPDEWAGRYAELRRSVGLSDHPDFLFFSSGAGWVGPESPRTPEEVSRLSDEELIEYLREWEPPGDFLGPSMRGLARALSSAVASDPDEFTRLAPRFKELDPTYVDGLLGGLVDAIRDKKGFDWGPVLELSGWVTQQPTTPPEGEDDRDREIGWRGSQQSVVRLLESGLESQEVAIPAELASAVWDALEPLTHHPDPTPEAEERYGEPNMDWLTYSLNTVRSKALHAVCAYVQRFGEGERLEGPLRVLEAHLEVEGDPSMAVRAVYGWWLPILVERAPDWTASMIGRILPQDPALEPYRLTAWSAYLMRWWPGEDLYRLLAPYYQLAVERMNEPGDAERSRGDRQGRDRLADHVAVLLYRGWIEETGLLAVFLHHASDDDRAQLVEFLGRVLHDTEDVPAEARTRLMGFWEGRLADDAADQPGPKELGAFGWWFASKHVDRHWALAALLQVVRRIRHIDASWRVLEQLVDDAAADPPRALEILQLLVTGPDPDQMIRHDERIKEVLREVLRVGDPDSKRRATDLVHDLGRRGYRDLRELLIEPAFDGPEPRESS